MLAEYIHRKPSRASLWGIYYKTFLSFFEVFLTVFSSHKNLSHIFGSTVHTQMILWSALISCKTVVKPCVWFLQCLWLTQNNFLLGSTLDTSTFQPVCELERQFLWCEKPSGTVGECLCTDLFYSADRCFKITPVHQMFQCIFSVRVCHFNVKI